MERSQYVEGKWQMTHSDEYSILVAKLATKRHRHWKKDIIKTNVKGVSCDGMHRNTVRQDNTRLLCTGVLISP